MRTLYLLPPSSSVNTLCVRYRSYFSLNAKRRTTLRKENFSLSQFLRKFFFLGRIPMHKEMSVYIRKGPKKYKFATCGINFKDAKENFDPFATLVK